MIRSRLFFSMTPRRFLRLMCWQLSASLSFAEVLFKPQRKFASLDSLDSERRSEWRELTLWKKFRSNCPRSRSRKSTASVLGRTAAPTCCALRATAACSSIPSEAAGCDDACDAPFRAQKPPICLSPPLTTVKLFLIYIRGDLGERNQLAADTRNDKSIRK